VGVLGHGPTTFGRTLKRIVYAESRRVKSRLGIDIGVAGDESRTDAVDLDR